MRETDTKRGAIIMYALLILASIFILIPIFFTICQALKSNVEIMTGSGGVFPNKPMFKNFIDVLTTEKKVLGGTVTFADYFINTAEIALMASVISCVFVSMGAYAIERGFGFGRNMFLALLFITLVFGTGTLNLYPLMKILLSLNLNNKFGLALLQASRGTPLLMLLYVAFLKGVSKNIDDSARMDGCSFFGIWLRIILPISKPVLSIIFIKTFCESVKDYLLPKLLLATDASAHTVSVAVAEMKATAGSASQLNYLMAASVLSLIPLVIILIVFNKLIVGAVTGGSSVE